MAGYGYATQGYNSHYGLGSQTYGQSRPMYTEYECSDHVCRPVIVDAEGRKQPIVSYSSPNYVVKTERVIEHVRAPLDEYKHSCPADEYGSKYNRREHSSSTPYPLPLVEESITSVHSEVSRPNPRPGFLGRTNWSESPYSTGNSSPISYGNSNNFSSKEFHMPNDETFTNEYYDTYSKRNDRIMEPSLAAHDGHSRPNHSMTAIQGSKLANPTNDIGAAVDYLKEAARPFSAPATLPQRRFSDPVLKRDNYDADTIDSREASQRYGNFSLSSHPIATRETYTATIDSREAMRKYGGAMI